MAYVRPNFHTEPHLIAFDTFYSMVVNQYRKAHRTNTAKAKLANPESSIRQWHYDSVKMALVKGKIVTFTVMASMSAEDRKRLMEWNMEVVTDWVDFELKSAFKMNSHRRQAPKLFVFDGSIDNGAPVQQELPL